MLRFWQSIPIIIRSVIIGSLMASAGTLPWAFFASLNIKYLPVVPWAILPTAIYLYFYWRFAQGKSWPRSTSHIRKTFCRANSLSADVWGAAILAGVLGLGALLSFQNLFSRMVRLPQQQTGDLSNVPMHTVFFLVVMSAIVAGIAEETSFRGYMQSPVERKFGPVVAILVTGSLFGVAHYSHSETTLALMPFYMGVAAVYGTLAYITNSILPGMLLHAGGNMLAALQLFGAGRSEWQAAPQTPALVWEKGADASFWLAFVITLVMIAVTVWAYRSLAMVVRGNKNAK
jgi:membrane protease YdiL (CAAX protease family)